MQEPKARILEYLAANGSEWVEVEELADATSIHPRSLYMLLSFLEGDEFVLTKCKDGGRYSHARFWKLGYNRWVREQKEREREARRNDSRREARAELRLQRKFQEWLLTPEGAEYLKKRLERDSNEKV